MCRGIVTNLLIAGLANPPPSTVIWAPHCIPPDGRNRPVSVDASKNSEYHWRLRSPSSLLLLLYLLLMLQVYRGHTSLVRSVSVEPNGQWLVSGTVTVLLVPSAATLKEETSSLLRNVLSYWASIVLCQSVLHDNRIVQNRKYSAQSLTPTCDKFYLCHEFFCSLLPLTSPQVTMRIQTIRCSLITELSTNLLLL